MLPTFWQKARLYLLLLAGFGTSCKSSHRDLPVGANGATLLIVMQGLATSDQNQPNYSYVLANCIATPATGNLGTPPTTVSVTAQGLKMGLSGCLFQVKTGTPIPGATFPGGGDPTVLYAANLDPIQLDLNGNLSVTAQLNQLYSLPVGTTPFTLVVPVTFPAAETATPITGALTCQPSPLNVGTYTATTATTGTLSFVTAANQSTQLTCTSLQVNAGTTLQKYVTAITGSNANAFTVAPSATVTWSNVALTAATPAAPAADPNAVSVTISTQDCNGTGKVFDTTTHQCVSTSAAASGGSPH